MLLDRLLLRPVTDVINEREGAMRAARDLADASRARAQAATHEFETKTRAARAEVYRQMEEKRRLALDSRAELVIATRREVEQLMHDATARVRAQSDVARTQLDREADALASTIFERVLGRKAS